MKKIKREYKVYKFKELSKEAKQEAIKNNYDINVNYDGWDDFIIEDEKESLTKKGFSDVKIMYTGFSSQGDGACFTGRIDSGDISKFCKDKKYALINRLVYIGLISLRGSIEHEGRYCHENSCRVSLENDYYFKTLKPKNAKKLDELINELEADIEAYRFDISQKIYERLNDEYNYLTDEEAIIETLEINDYDFTVDGKIFA